jgi:hypothetical protein
LQIKKICPCDSSMIQSPERQRERIFKKEESHLLSHWGGMRA